jgi:hypothetical protein
MDLDGAEFIRLLIASLEGCPEDVPAPSGWGWEGELGKLVAKCDAPQVWQTLEKVARRSTVRLRLELLHSASESSHARHRPLRLRLLAGFLDDAALKDASSGDKFGGPGAGFPYNKIEVRNVVASELGEMLGIPVEVDLNRTPEQWAAIRKAVREALKQEGVRTKDPQGDRSKRP